MKIVLKIPLSYTGILAGLWPCGIITLLCELFTAESKAQVYGHLHSMLQGSPEISDNLGMQSLALFALFMMECHDDEDNYILLLSSSLLLLILLICESQNMQLPY